MVDGARKGKAIFFFLLMLLMHIAHVFEEVWGQFRAIDVLGGPGRFLIVNWILLSLVVLLLYFIIRGSRAAYNLGILYAAIMILNGIGHNIATLVTGEYFGAFAGGFAGIGLILAGPPLIYYLRKEKPRI
ncbi:MAG: hypothetical protein JSU69_05965 [Candidatus Zixiibacteriota bacterium]|nr:MAG: hypothetical protein JSU69_05965 [candidate division Zixibacteria bacterium]